MNVMRTDLINEACILGTGHNNPLPFTSLTNQLPPWSRILLGKLIIAQLVNKFPAFLNPFSTLAFVITWAFEEDGDILHKTELFTNC
jgi:hypothetical protein